MTEVHLRDQELAAFTDDVAAYHQSFGKDFWRLLWAAVAELATGKPVEPQRLAARAGMPLDRTLAIAREAWEWDPSDQRVVGAGLTLHETAYRVDIDGTTTWTYCAPDTLELPVILDKPVQTHSSCAATGDPIRVHATPTSVDSVNPPTTVVSFPDPSSRPSLVNVQQVSCNQSSYYRDADAAAGWLAANPHGWLLPVTDAFVVLRTSMLRLKEWFNQ